MTDQARGPEGKAPAWKTCSLCKKGIPYGATYYTCSVSTCKNKKLGIIFCSYLCWDGHLGFARHRDSWAEEATAPQA